MYWYIVYICICIDTLYTYICLCIDTYTYICIYILLKHSFVACFTRRNGGTLHVRLFIYPRINYSISNLILGSQSEMQAKWQRVAGEIKVGYGAVTHMQIERELPRLRTRSWDSPSSNFRKIVQSCFYVSYSLFAVRCEKNP
jgi:hypothetical protein